LYPSRLPLEDIVLCVYARAREDTSVQWCMRELQMSPVETVDWCSFMRAVCAFKLNTMNTMDNGEGYMVECCVGRLARECRVGCCRLRAPNGLIPFRLSSHGCTLSKCRETMVTGQGEKQEILRCFYLCCIIVIIIIIMIILCLFSLYYFYCFNY
jgi:hypothetical protein